MPPVYRVLLCFIVSACAFPSSERHMMKDRNTHDERWTQNVEDKSFASVFPSDLCSVSHVWKAAAYHGPGVVSHVRCVGIYSECTVALCVLEGALRGVRMSRHVVGGPALRPYLNIQSLLRLWFRRCRYFLPLTTAVYVCWKVAEFICSWLCDEWITPIRCTVTLLQ